MLRFLRGLGRKVAAAPAHVLVRARETDGLQLALSRRAPRASAADAHSKLLRLLDRLASREDIARLLPASPIGIELGVAFGGFARRLLDRHPTMYLYGVDMYAGDRHHTTEQYCQALRHLQPHERRSKLLRMRFDEAVHVFPDRFFDFIYIDGYAHTGQEDGETIRQWYPKLKPGGVVAVDDYSSEWPQTVDAVDRFLDDCGLALYLLTKCADRDRQEYPSWFAIKPADDGRHLDRVLDNALGNGPVTRWSDVAEPFH